MTGRASSLAGTLTVVLVATVLVGDVAAVTPQQFKAAVNVIRDVPYNPRPIATDTQDVTGISESDTRDLFLAEFTRVTLAAPRNGRTFQATVPGNASDITLVAYQRFHGATPPRPAVVLSHGGHGEGSIALHQGFLLHLARVLYANGYDVLAVDQRAGLLSRCAYAGGPPVPDPARSKPWKAGVLASDPDVDAEKTDFCDTLPTGFVDTAYTPNTAVSSFGAFEAGDILSAAKYVQAQTGTSAVGVLSGSLGGLALVRAAALQGAAGTDFPAGLLAAILAVSPFGDYATYDLASSSAALSCLRVKAAKAYSTTVPGTGLGDFTTDPEGTTTGFYALLDGIGAIAGVTVPTLTLHALSDDQVFANTAVAYRATTNPMALAQSPIVARTGHFHEMWQSDPYWVDRVALVYFKRMLALGNATITADPGFASLGPNTDNPLLLSLDVPAAAVGKLVAPASSFVPYLAGTCY